MALYSEQSRGGYGTRRLALPRAGLSSPEGYALTPQAFSISSLVLGQVLHHPGKNIIYIGDGLSDLEAARHADHVFATGHLLDLFNSEPVVCNGFSDFRDLLRQVRLLF